MKCKYLVSTFAAVWNPVYNLIIIWNVNVNLLLILSNLYLVYNLIIIWNVNNIVLIILKTNSIGL